VCNVSLAINRTWTGADGVKKEEVTFVDCACFGKQAETLSKYKKKGDPLYIEGRLKLDQWEAQDGTKRSKMKIVIENFQFLNRSQGEHGGGEQGGYGGEPGERGGRQPQRQANRGAQDRAPRGHGGPARGPGGAGGGGGASRTAEAPAYDAGDMEESPADLDDLPF
jgi:single-strand DNA-binding protein